MTIPFRCECGQAYETPDANAGRRAMCPVCCRELTVPRAAPEGIRFLPDDGPEVDLTILDEPAAAVATSGKAIASFVLGLLFVFACLTGLPAIVYGCEALVAIKRSDGRLRGRGLAWAGIGLGVIGTLFTFTSFASLEDPRTAARRSLCTNNLKQIGLALHNYADVYGCLPPAAITDTDGKPLLSWRVSILPYLEQAPLYSEFHLDEPWDSPHNRALLDEMPIFYGCPSDVDRDPEMTGYQAIVGPRAAFSPDFKPLRFEDFTDGLGNTLLVGESRRVTPWTKPVDLPSDPGLRLLGLGSHHHDGFNALFADGSMRFLKDSIQLNILLALFTRDGGEVIPDGSY